MLCEIVDKRASGDALIPSDAKIFVGHSTIAEMNFRCRVLHPLAAKPGPIEKNVAIALPVFRVSIFSADRQLNHWRPCKFPLAEKLLDLGRNERTQRPRLDRTIGI